MVKDVEISPPNPRPGEPINITIKGSCREVAPVEIDYEQTIPIGLKKFAVQINKVQVPWPKNRLLILAKNVSSLNLAAKFLIWIHKKVEVVDGVAQYTLRDVPKGTYTVKLDGTALEGGLEAMIKVAAFSELQLDEEGVCLYTFCPSPDQCGNLSVKCNQLEKEVKIRE